MESGGISVTCRVRPPPSSVSASAQCWVISDVNTNTILNKKSKDSYTFAKLYAPNVNNNLVLEDVRPLLNDVLEGYHGCVAAYGQSGSGKTHTMTGSGDEPGLVQLAIGYLLDRISKSDRMYVLKCSFLDLYNEHLRDLLSESDVEPSIRDGSDGQCFIEGVTYMDITNVGDVMELIERGQNRRAWGTTNLNERSSRSHVILRVTVESEDKEGDAFLSTLQLVDLAGSEGAAAYSEGATVYDKKANETRMREGRNINKSLLAFTKVIRELANPAGKSAFISFRDSKLTRVLKQSLGNSKLFLVCTVNTADEAATTSTLSFAKTAACVRVNPKKNHKKQGEGDIDKYKLTIVNLQNQLQTTKADSEIEKQRVQEMEKKLENMQKILLGGGGAALVAQPEVKQVKSRRFSWAPGLTGSSAFAPLAPLPRNLKRSAITMVNDLSVHDADKEKKARQVATEVCASLEEIGEENWDGQLPSRPGSSLSDDGKVRDSSASFDLSPSVKLEKEISSLNEKLTTEKERCEKLEKEVYQLKNDYQAQSDVLAATQARVGENVEFKKVFSETQEHVKVLLTQISSLEEQKAIDGKTLSCTRTEMEILKSQIISNEERSALLEKVQAELHVERSTRASLQSQFEDLREKWLECQEGDTRQWTDRVKGLEDDLGKAILRGERACENAKRAEDELEAMRRKCFEERETSRTSTERLLAEQIRVFEEAHEKVRTDMGQHIKALESELAVEKASAGVLKDKLMEKEEDLERRGGQELRQRLERAECDAAALRAEEKAQQERIGFLERKIDDFIEAKRLDSIVVNDLRDELAVANECKDRLLKSLQDMEQGSHMEKAAYEERVEGIEKIFVEKISSMEAEKVDLVQKVDELKKSLGADSLAEKERHDAAILAEKKKLAAAELRITELQEQLVAVRADVVRDVQLTVEKEWEKDKEAIRQLEIENRRLEERNRMLQEQTVAHPVPSAEEISSLRAQLEDAEDALKLEEEKVADREEALRAAEAKYHSLQNQLALNCTRLTNQSELCNSLKESVCEKRLELNKANDDIAKEKSRAKKADEKSSRLRTELESAQENASHLLDQIKDRDSQLSALHIKITDHEADLSDIRKTLNRTDVLLANEKSRLEIETAKVAALEAENKDLKLHNEAVERERRKEGIDEAKENERLTTQLPIQINAKCYKTIDELIKRVTALEEQRDVGLKKYNKIIKEKDALEKRLA